MASAELLLKTLDANGNEIQNIHVPTQAGSATTTDNTTTPAPDSAAGAAGSSLLASPADHSHPASASTVNKISISHAGAAYEIGIGEDIIREFYVDFNDAGAANIKAKIAAIVKVSAASTGTFNVRTGATNPGSTVGSTVRATITTSSLTEVPLEVLGASFANPAGLQLVQVTANNDTAAIKSYIRGIQITLG